MTETITITITDKETSMTKIEAYALGKIRAREDMVTLAERSKEAGVLLSGEEITALPLIQRTEIQMKAFKLGMEVREETVSAFDQEVQHEKNAEELARAFRESMYAEGMKFLEEMGKIGEAEFLKKVLEEERQRREESTS